MNSHHGICQRLNRNNDFNLYSSSSLLFIDYIVVVSTGGVVEKAKTKIGDSTGVSAERADYAVISTRQPFVAQPHVGFLKATAKILEWTR